MDTDGWKSNLSIKHFWGPLTGLCKAIDNLIEKLCSEKISSSSLEIFLASRLIPLDKIPGLQTTGMTEEHRLVTGKVVLSALCEDSISSVGSAQECASHDVGCEAAVHALHSIFEDENFEAVLLIDAGNGFSTVNQKIFVLIMDIICATIYI